MVHRDGDQLRPRVILAAVDNESMNGANPANCGNVGKNSNVHSIATIRHTATSFAEGFKKASTQMILCPASREYGDRKGWVEFTLRAASASMGVENTNFTVEQVIFFFSNLLSFFPRKVLFSSLPSLSGLECWFYHFKGVRRRSS